MQGGEIGKELKGSDATLGASGAAISAKISVSTCSLVSWVHSVAADDAGAHGLEQGHRVPCCEIDNRACRGVSLSIGLRLLMRSMRGREPTLRIP